MQALKTITLTTAFLLELVMLFSLGYYGYHSSANKILNITLAIALPLIVIIIWAIFAAPKANYRITFPSRIFFELALFLLSAFLLYIAGKPSWATTFATIAIITEIFSFILKL